MSETSSSGSSAIKRSSAQVASLACFMASAKCNRVPCSRAMEVRVKNETTAKYEDNLS